MEKIAERQTTFDGHPIFLVRVGNVEVLTYRLIMKSYEYFMIKVFLSLSFYLQNNHRMIFYCFTIAVG